MAYLDELAKLYEEEVSPLTLAFMFLGVLLFAGGAVGCIIGLVIRQKRIARQLIQAELELAALRVFAPQSER